MKNKFKISDNLYWLIWWFMILTALTISDYINCKKDSMKDVNLQQNNSYTNNSKTE